MQGPSGTFDYRLFMTEGGKVASFWHDIPLDNGDGTVNFVCEIPKETKAKMEVSTVRHSIQQSQQHLGTETNNYLTSPSRKLDCAAFCYKHTSGHNNSRSALGIYFPKEAQESFIDLKGNFHA